jgi:hypothetical protein
MAWLVQSSLWRVVMIHFRDEVHEWSWRFVWHVGSWRGVKTPLDNTIHDGDLWSPYMRKISHNQGRKIWRARRERSTLWFWGRLRQKRKAPANIQVTLHGRTYVALRWFSGKSWVTLFLVEFVGSIVIGLRRHSRRLNHMYVWRLAIENIQKLCGWEHVLGTP